MLRGPGPQGDATNGSSAVPEVENAAFVRFTGAVRAASRPLKQFLGPSSFRGGQLVAQVGL